MIRFSPWFHDCLFGFGWVILVTRVGRALILVTCHRPTRYTPGSWTFGVSCFRTTWNAKCPIFWGNFTPKTSNYCLKNRALGFPGIYFDLNMKHVALMNHFESYLGYFNTYIYECPVIGVLRGIFFPDPGSWCLREKTVIATGVSCECTPFPTSFYRY